MRSIPWALPGLVAVMVTCVLALMSGGREVEACSTSPIEVTGALERSITRLIRPRQPALMKVPARSADPLDPRPSHVDRVRRIVSQLAADLEPGRYSAPYWNTRLHAAALELGHDTARTLASLDREAQPPAVRATIAELLRVSRTEMRAHGARPSDNATRAARQAIDRESSDRAIPFDVAARTLAAWGDFLDQELLLAMASAAEDEGTRGTLFLALGHAPSARVGLELAGEPTPEAMIGLSVFAQESAWVLGDHERTQVTEILEVRVLDAEAPEPLRHRALGALLAWKTDGAMETLVDLALDPQTPESLARSAVTRLARGEHAEALERGLVTDSLRRLQLAEALAARAATTTDAGLRGAVLDVLCQAAHGETAPHERRRAVHALAKLPDPIALDTVARTLDEDPDPAVRAAAVVALRGFPLPDARRLLDLAAERDRSDTVRRLALHELGRSRTKE